MYLLKENELNIFYDIYLLIMNWTSKEVLDIIGFVWILV